MTTTLESIVLQPEFANNRQLLVGSLIVGCICILIALMALLLRALNARDSSRKLLNYKDEQIEQLSKEKEWLLGEVHHRVRNNLQTVVSLLESQLAYLKNDEALSAIQDSQNRVYAMSLIYQKLYKAGNVASLDMSAYLKELLTFLKDFFPSGRLVRFSLELDSIELDVSQAIPLGLILNEVITNMLKYAFQEYDPESKAVITMRQSERMVSLSIKAMGCSLRGNIDTEIDNCAFGLELVRGLSGDLDGKFEVISTNGLTINIVFEASVPLATLNLSRN